MSWQCMCTARNDSLVAAPVSSLGSPEEEGKAEEERKAEESRRKKNNKSARKAARKLVAAAGKEFLKVADPKYADEENLVRVTDCIDKRADLGVPSWIAAGTYNYDSLVESLGERLSMFEAKIIFAKYHDLDYDDVDELRARNSSAGVFGWAVATI